jgi:hypothetical protein
MQRRQARPLTRWQQKPSCNTLTDWRKKVANENEDTSINTDAASRHELMDRLYCMTTMFDHLIRNHPAAVLMQDEIERVSMDIAGLYTESGNLQME